MLVLASQSASRKAMLADAGIACEAVPADIDERAIEAGLGETEPGAVARALAVAKAHAVSALRPARIVLGSDSLVTAGERRFDKPASREQAAEHLRYFSGREMRLTSAAALVRDAQTLWECDVTAALQVRQLTESFIETYLDREWPAVSGCVGVFRIEGLGVQLFEDISGDHFTVLGMPLLKVMAALRALGELPR